MVLIEMRCFRYQNLLLISREYWEISLLQSSTNLASQMYPNTGHFTKRSWETQYHSLTTMDSSFRASKNGFSHIIHSKWSQTTHFKAGL